MYSLNFYSKNPDNELKGNIQKGSFKRETLKSKLARGLSLMLLLFFGIVNFGTAQCDGFAVSIDATENSGNPDDGTICAGAIQLNANPVGGTGPYGDVFWIVGTDTVATGGGTSLSAVLSPTETTTYTVCVFDANGCVAKASYLVTVVGTLEVQATTIEFINIYNDGFVCESDGAKVDVEILSGAGPFTYSWSNAAQLSDPATDKDPSIDVSAIGAPGTASFTVTVTDSNGCTAESTTSITVNDSPTVAAIAPASGCVDEVVNLPLTVPSGGSGVYTTTYSSFFGTIDNSVSPATFTSSIAGVFTISAIVSDDNGCAVETSFTLEIFSAPVVNLSQDPSCVMSGGVANIDVVNDSHNALYTYMWFKDAALTIPVADDDASTPEVLDLDGEGPTSTPLDFYVIVTDANGCTATSSISVVLYESPTIMTSNLEICSGCSGVLDATVSGGATPYSYAWTAVADGSYSSSVATPIVSVADTYNVVVTDANGCSVSGSVLVTNSTMINRVVTIDVCDGDDLSVLAETNGICGILSFAWSTGESTSSITVSPAYPASVSVAVTNDTGCTLNLTYNINAVTPVDAGADVTIVSCSSGFNGMDTRDLFGALAGASPGGNWVLLTNPLDADMVDLQNQAQTNAGVVDFNNAPAGEYIFQYLVSDPSGVCPDDFAMVTVNVSSCFDLALEKNICTIVRGGTTLAPPYETGGPYLPGDIVTYAITVHNQGLVRAFDVVVNDYLPNEMTLVPTNISGTCTPLIPPASHTIRDWTLDANPSPVLQTTSYVASNGLGNASFFAVGAGVSKRIFITAQVNANAMASTLLNTAEIVSWRDTDGDMVLDEDGLNNIDIGAQTPVEADDEISDMGGDGLPDDPLDEDAMDFAAINVMCMAQPYACNDQVQVSLGANCSAEVTPDMIIEGGQDGPNCGYTVILKDANGDVLPSSPIVNLSHIGMTITAEVHSMGMNDVAPCWGTLTVEDKLPPQLDCLDPITVSCAQEFNLNHGNTSNSAAAVVASGGVAIPDGAPGTAVAFTVDVTEACEFFDLITDIKIDVDATVSNLANWQYNVMNPDGSLVTGWVNLTGSGLADLSALDGLQAVNGLIDGTWTVQIRDNVAGGTTSITGINITFGCTSYFVTPPFNVGGCDPTNELIILSDEFDRDFLNCGSNMFSAKRTITYVTEDAFGNQSTPVCEWDIFYERQPLADIVFPPHWNGVDRPTLSCDGTFINDNPPPFRLIWDTNGNGFPDPEETGYPTIDGVELNPSYEGLCELAVTFEDSELPIDDCPFNKKLLRKWTVLDWCASPLASDNPREFFQIIKIMDDTPPIAVCSIPLGLEIPVTDRYNCTATYDVPAPTVNPNGCGTYTYTISFKTGVTAEDCNNPPADVAALIEELQFTTVGVSGNATSGFTINGLQAGCNWINYVVTDECGNSTSFTCDIMVIDTDPPIPICDEHTVVSLNSDNVAKIFATTFDDGSFDACTDVSFQTMRYNTTECDGSAPVWNDYIQFCCDDVGSEIMVALLVTDEAGNTNSCMVSVTVDDKFPAQWTYCPPNMTVDCLDNTDVASTGGMATAMDNCFSPEVNFTESSNINDCGTGNVRRTWTASDASGNVVLTKTQTITVGNSSPFAGPIFPADRDLTCMGSIDPAVTGSPNTSSADACAFIAATFEDQTFELSEEACVKILRHWTVIDWCTYNGNQPTGNPSNPFPGMFRSTQVLRVNNTIAPSFESGCMSSSINGETGSCSAEVSFTALVSDDCTADSDLEVSFTIDYNSDGSVDFRGNGINFSSSSVPFGNHRVNWLATDRCGNDATCSATLNVRDTKAPTPYCLGGVTTVLMDNSGQVTIWAEDFNIGSFDNCPDANLTYTIRPKRSEITPTPNFTFTCDDADQIIEVEVHVTDESGNSDFCFTFIRIQDNGACGGNANAMISGLIKTESDQTMDDVEVMLEDMTTYTQNMDNTVTGAYEFNAERYNDYELTAAKNDDPLNGVSTLDLVKIQRHILGIEAITSPYKIVAADINNSQSVSASDLVELRRLILGLNDDFQNNTSWRFVEAQQQFANPTFPWPLNEVINVNYLEQDEMAENFVAIKVGDINDNAVANNYVATEVRSFPESVNLEIIDQKVTKGQVVQIPVFATANELMTGMQFTLSWNQADLEFVSIDAGNMSITKENFGTRYSDRGMITFSWNEVQAMNLSKGDMMFKLNFNSKSELENLSQLNINSKVTPAEAYDASLKLKGIELSIKDKDLVDPLGEIVLHQNRPNPFKNATVIDISVPAKTSLMFNVYDLNGKLIYSEQKDFEPGLNTIEIDKDNVNAVGLLYYEVETNGKRWGRKMLKVE